MTLDGLLTFLTLVVGLYALAPQVARLRIKIRLAMPIALSALTLAAVLYFEFFDVLGQPCRLPSTSVCEWVTVGATGSLSAQQWAFLTILLWSILVLASLAPTALSPRNLPALTRLVDALASERRFAELCDLARPHLRLIEEVTKRNRGWARVQDRLLPSSSARLDKLIGALRGDQDLAATTWRDRMLAQLEPLLRIVAKVLPQGEREQAAAREIQRILYRREDFITFVAARRPEFGLLVLSGSGNYMFQFSQVFFSCLIGDPNSRLYEEVEANQNITSSHGYEFPEHNRILYFLFSDARRAERLGVWEPIMEAAIARLHQDRTNEYVEYLSGSASRFEKAKWRDQTYVAIRFLDLMVDAAMRQELRWHMWLYYAPHLLKPLLAIYDETGPGVDPDAELPTRTSYLIYSLFKAMTDWICAVRELPEGSNHLTIQSEQPTHENGNIPKSAILALGTCIRMLLACDHVSERFKRYIYEDVVLSALRRLPQDGSLSAFRRAMVNGLIAGGPQRKQDHHQLLREFFDQADFRLREDLEDFDLALAAAGPALPVNL